MLKNISKSALCVEDSEQRKQNYAPPYVQPSSSVLRTSTHISFIRMKNASFNSEQTTVYARAHGSMYYVGTEWNKNCNKYARGKSCPCTHSTWSAAYRKGRLIQQYSGRIKKTIIYNYNNNDNSY